LKYTSSKNTSIIFFQKNDKEPNFYYLKTNWENSLKYIPEKLLKRMDENGKVENPLNFPYTYMYTTNLKPLYLFHIKPIKNWKELHELKNLPVLIKKPLFMVNSISPINIPKNIQIIENEKDVIPVVMRVLNGIYFPVKATLSEPEEYFYTDTWLLGCEVEV